MERVDPLQGLDHIQEYLRTYSVSLLSVDDKIGRLKEKFDLKGDEEREKAQAMVDTRRLDGHEKEVIRARRNILESIRKNTTGSSLDLSKVRADNVLASKQ